eukprot:6471048-Amphidinium_carterae.1
MDCIVTLHGISIFFDKLEDSAAKLVRARQKRLRPHHHLAQNHNTKLYWPSVEAIHDTSTMASELGHHGVMVDTRSAVNIQHHHIVSSWAPRASSQRADEGWQSSTRSLLVGVPYRHFLRRHVIMDLRGLLCRCMDFG